MFAHPGVEAEVDEDEERHVVGRRRLLVFHQVMRVCINPISSLASDRLTIDFRSRWQSVKYTHTHTHEWGRAGGT